jgi:hypothetical protein
VRRPSHHPTGHGHRASICGHPTQPRLWAPNSEPRLWTPDSAATAVPTRAVADPTCGHPTDPTSGHPTGFDSWTPKGLWTPGGLVDTLRLVDTQQTATGAPAEAVGCTCGVRLCAAVGTTTIPAVTVALTPILRCVFGHPTSGCAPGNPAASASGEPRGRRQGCVPGRGSWTPTKAARGHPFSAFLDTHSTPRSALGIRTQSCSDRSSTACSLHVLEFQEFRTRTEGVHGHHKVHEFRTPSQVVHGHHRVKRVSIEAPANLPRGCVRCGGQRART